MPDPFTVAAAGIVQITNAEFEEEGFVAQYDRLHESLGLRATEIGVSPLYWAPMPSNRNARETFILVQFYDLWDKEVNPSQQVDPRRITDFADRFEKAIQGQRGVEPGTGDVWYYTTERVEFPNDPTGNKTRFHATIRAHGNNHGMIEETGA